jgi:AraC-like DNA-binding protein
LKTLSTPSPAAPLASCLRFTTSDPEVAVHEATKLLSPHQLVLDGDRTDFAAHASRSQLSDTALYTMSYSDAGTFHCAPQHSYVAVLLPTAGDLSIRYHKRDPVEVPCGSFAVVPADRPVDISYRDGMSMLVVTAGPAALTSGLRRIAPELEDDQLRFDEIVTYDGGSVGTFYGLARLLARTVDRYTSPSFMSSNVVYTLRDQIVSTFVLDLPHTKSESMLRFSTPISNRLVRRALDAVASEDIADSSVTDIAAKLGVSVRSLELGFRKELNCTPREYIQKIRLQKAHDDLTEARPGDGTTVTDVALRWGFNHTGRFAALYKRVYGVAPSTELRD